MMEMDTSGTSNPLANQQAPEQAPPQGNPLARIAPQLGPPPPIPMPNRAQTMAAVRRFSAIQEAMRAVMSDKDFGHSNVRPVLMDEASKLLASKLISLPELMNQLSNFPSDPIKQKETVQGIFNQAQRAEASVLDHHGSAIVAGKLTPDGGPEYDAGSHEQAMQGLLSHYQRA